MIKPKGYSLWLVPQGKIYQKLSQIIKDLSLKYSSPVFEPHVTLLGGITGDEKEIIAKTEKLATEVAPFKLHLNDVDYLDEYFRALFVKVEKTNALLAIYRQAKDVFKIEDVQEFMPHLSLIYGDFPKSLKEQIIKEIGQNFGVEFEVEDIHLFKTAGSVENWPGIKIFPLRQKL